MPTATKEHKEVMAERNIEIRDRLLKFWRENYEPKFKLISSEIDVSYTNMRRYVNKHHNFGKKNLDKLEKF
ncbi:hypothetical protein [Staphylococcus epidermidis]|nr:hypothetical protein [Staphylococcus epidermidis]QXU91402.1 hypothetical protein KFV31_13335 [Staphylococcus epidermidis]